MAATLRFVESPEGQTLPFIANRLHAEGGRKVPQRMLFPSADMLAAAIAAIPAGRSSNLAAVRGALAVEHGAASTCPVTSQRLLRDIAAGAVAGWEAGRRDVAPFWRVVDPDRPTARLLSGGAAFIRARRADEAH